MAVKTFTTGEVLTASDTNTYLTNAGLVYVTSTTVGSGVSTITLLNCFSSAYDNFRVTITNVAVSTTATVTFRLANSGGTASTTTYGVSGYYQIAGSGLSSNWTTTGDLWEIAPATTAAPAHGYMDIFAPNLAVYSRMATASMSTGVAIQYQGMHLTNTAYPSLVVGATGGATMTGGTITVFGYRKA